MGSNSQPIPESNNSKMSRMIFIRFESNAEEQAAITIASVGRQAFSQSLDKSLLLGSHILSTIINHESLVWAHNPVSLNPKSYYVPYFLVSLHF